MSVTDNNSNEPSTTNTQPTTSSVPNDVDQAFLAYDWDGSKGWNEYLNNLYPIPTGIKLLKFRKKWFKNNVDDTFDVNTSVGEDEFKKKEDEQHPTGRRTNNNTTTTSSQQQSSSSRTTSSTTTTQSSTTDSTATSSRILWNSVCSILLSLAIALHFASIMPLGSLSARSRAASVVCYLLGFAGSVFATHGLPQWNGQWWQLVMYHEGLQNFLMTMSALPIRVWIVMISPFITALCILSNAIPRSLASVPPLNKALEIIQTNKTALTKARADIEIYAGLFFIIAGIMGRINFLSCFMYWNTLRMKYSINTDTKQSFAQLNNRITGLLSHPSVPSSILTVYNKLAGVMNRYGEAGQ